MRNLFFIISMVIILASCRKIKCSNQNVRLVFTTDTLVPDSSKVIIKRFAKGTQWQNPLDSVSTMKKFNVDFSFYDSDLSSDNDYLVEIETPYKQYKITDIEYKDNKTYESALGQTYKNCTNGINYKINGESHSTSLREGEGGTGGFINHQQIQISRY